MAEAVADLIIFVDDGNVFPRDYVSHALRINKEWPTLGTWGAGSIIPEFESQPADYLRAYLVCLVLRNYDKACWSNVLSCNDATPNGAGLCVRARVAKESAFVILTRLYWALRDIPHGS
jgi:hypothetical protein